MMLVMFVIDIGCLCQLSFSVVPFSWILWIGKLFSPWKYQKSVDNIQLKLISLILNSDFHIIYVGIYVEFTFL